MNLTILSESHPKRCEVCHQSDRFDPKTNFCGRCTIVEIPQKNAVIPASVPVPRFCLLSEMTPDEIEGIPTMDVFYLVVAIIHNLLFYSAILLMDHSIFLQMRAIFGGFADWVNIGMTLALLVSFLAGWSWGLLCTQNAWWLYQDNREFRTFLISGFFLFWPSIQVIILFTLVKVGLIPDYDC